MKPLLVLVDLQHDFLNAAALEPAAGVVVQQAARLLQRCRELQIPVAHVWTTVRRSPDDRMPHWREANRWDCEAGTLGHQTPSPLSPLAGEALIHKTAFSAFATGEFTEWLRAHAIDTLVVAGVHLHACVRQTVLDAYQAGLGVWVAEDAVGSDDPLHAAITRRYLGARGIQFAPVEAMLNGLRGAATLPAAETPGRVRQAIASARHRSGAWRHVSLQDRVSLVRRLATGLADDAAELAELIACEIGKPIRFGRVEVERTAVMLGAIHGRFATLNAEEAVGTASVRRRPHGVVAVITPWNNPVYLALGKIVPAILAGNAVVWKPAPEAKLVSLRIRDHLAAAGWPEGLVNLLEGGRRVGEELMNDPQVAAVTLTGSSAAGHSAQAICARRRVPLQAELGGNNAALVWTDANLGEAAQRIAAGAFELAGQRCTATRRAIVPENCREDFLDLLAQATASLHWGDPLHPDTQIGPLIHAAHRDRVRAAVARAVADCGRALLPLGPTSDVAAGPERAWYPPTILQSPDPRLEIVQEETFGPVLVVQTARDWDHAMNLCNGVRQGLAAAVFTRSADVARRFLDEAEAGILKVNQSTADAEVDVPFGGWKESGLGPPEHGACDLEFYLRPQTVYGSASLGLQFHATLEAIRADRAKPAA